MKNSLLSTLSRLFHFHKWHYPTTTNHLLIDFRFIKVETRKCLVCDKEQYRDISEGINSPYKYKTLPAKPSCYGSDPNVVEMAENDCKRCLHSPMCLTKTKQLITNYEVVWNEVKEKREELRAQIAYECGRGEKPAKTD